MSDLTDKERSGTTRIVGRDELFAADVVEQEDGSKALKTDASVTIQEIFGQDPKGTTWAYIGTNNDASGVGNAGDTVRNQIVAGALPSLWPDVDVTTTVTSGMVASSNPEAALADQIIADLNANSNFSTSWKALRIKDLGGYFIESKLFNEWGERLTANSFQVTTTGTTVITIAFTTIKRRGLPNELARSPNDPRQGILGISGSVVTTPGEIGLILSEHLRNGGASKAMNVNGSVTPVVFSVGTEVNFDRFIQEIRIHATCAGSKFGQFLNLNAPLTNGLKLELQSDNQYFIDSPTYKTTEDLFSEFAKGKVNFSLLSQPSLDFALASWQFEVPFPLRKTGSFTTDDYVKITVQDALGAVASLEAQVFGFKKEEV